MLFHPLWLAQGSALPSHLLILFHYAAVTKALLLLLLLLFAAAVVALFVRAPRPNAHPPMQSWKLKIVSNKHTTSEKYEEIRHYTFFALIAVSAVRDDDDDEEESIGTVIGIDLGTTYSCLEFTRTAKLKSLPTTKVTVLLHHT